MFFPKNENQGHRGALHHSYSQFPNFRAKHKLALTVSLSQQQLRGKEDATAPVKIRASTSRFFSHHTALFAYQKHQPSSKLKLKIKYATSTFSNSERKTVSFIIHNMQPTPAPLQVQGLSWCSQMPHFITIWLDLYLITSILTSTPQYSINSKIIMQKNLWFLKTKLFLSILIKSLQYLKHYPWEKIIPHKQILWYFIILHIPEAVKEKLLATSLLLNRQLQVHLKSTIIPLHPE